MRHTSISIRNDVVCVIFFCKEFREEKNNKKNKKQYQNCWFSRQKASLLPERDYEEKCKSIFRCCQRDDSSARNCIARLRISLHFRNTNMTNCDWWRCYFTVVRAIQPIYLISTIHPSVHFSRWDINLVEHSRNITSNVTLTISSRTAEFGSQK